MKGYTYPPEGAFVPMGEVPRPINGSYLKTDKLADLSGKCAHGVTPEHCADCHSVLDFGKEFIEPARAHLDAAAARKAMPVATGVLDYFPDALKEVARVSKVANDQHNPGEPMHWNRAKSTDHADCLLRHMMDRGRIDDDGLRHSAKVAWRALALLQTEMERA